MRQLTLITASLIAAVTLLSACGTKGPLTLPAKPATDATTGAGQH